MNKKINIWTKLSDLVEDQLNLQVKIQFDYHHKFMLNSGLSDCKKVMDLGTGNGSFLKELANKHSDITFIGVEKDDHMMNKATEKEVANITWLKGDANIPHEISELDQADGILMRYLLLHLNDTSSVISDLYKVLKPNAKLWIIDLDLENYICKPESEEFNLIKKLVRDFCNKHGKDVNIGSKLKEILNAAGFKSINYKVEPLNTDTIRIDLLQRFLIQEVTAYNVALGNTLNKKDFEKIKVFIDDLPNSKTFLNYGVKLFSAIK